MGPGGEWLTGWASAKPFPGKDTRTLTSDRVVFSRYNLGRHLRGSQVPQKKRKARINVQFPRLDALLVSAVIRVNGEGRKLTLKGLILRKRAQALLLVLTHPAPNHLPHFTEQRNDLPAQHCHGLTEICDSRAQAHFTTLTTLSAKKKKKKSPSTIEVFVTFHIATCACVPRCFSHVQFFPTPGTVARQAPLSMGILQARVLQWVAVPSSSRGSSRPKG